MLIRQLLGWAMVVCVIGGSQVFAQSQLTSSLESRLQSAVQRSYPTSLISSSNPMGGRRSYQRGTEYQSYHRRRMPRIGLTYEHDITFSRSIIQRQHGYDPKLQSKQDYREYTQPIRRFEEGRQTPDLLERRPYDTNQYPISQPEAIILPPIPGTEDVEMLLPNEYFPGLGSRQRTRLNQPFEEYKDKIPKPIKASSRNMNSAGMHQETLSEETHATFKIDKSRAGQRLKFEYNATRNKSSAMRGPFDPWLPTSHRLQSGHLASAESIPAERLGRVNKKEQKNPTKPNKKIYGDPYGREATDPPRQNRETTIGGQFFRPDYSYSWNGVKRYSVGEYEYENNPAYIGLPYYLGR